ncbi:MAG: hypothetical protein WCD79_05910, partial [Chthoniobacteraceae bacterium]
TGQPSLEALLVTALSKTEGIELVERTEINRIVDEKRLADFTETGKFASLGGLIRADGVLIIESIPVPGKEPVATARLVSVKSGACLLATLLPQKDGETFKDEPDAWAGLMARDVARLAGKLMVSRESAVPLSVLNIRATLRSRENSALELSVTKLLEARLASVENVILLERRQLRGIQFERRLDATDVPPLSNSVIVVDGSFTDGGQPDGPVEVKIRLRQKERAPIAAATVKGKMSDAPALADTVADTVLEAIKQKPPAAAWDREKEAAVFFDEGVWAWRAGEYEAAVEALEAARALGDQSPDIAALETWLFCEEAWPSHIPVESRHLVNPISAQLPPPEKQNEAFLEAFASLKEFEEAGETLTKLKLDMEPTRGLDEKHLRGQLFDRGSEFLYRNDHATQPINAEPLRQCVRSIAGMKGQAPGDPETAMANSTAVVCDSVELIAFYEKLLRAGRGRGKMLLLFPRSTEDALGVRFQNDPKAVWAWNDLLTRLCSDPDPATRLRGLLIRAGKARTPEQIADYRSFLLELGRQGASLYEAGQLGIFLNGDGNRRGFEEERGELLRTLCDTLPGYEWGLNWLVNLKVPDDLREKTWEAYLKYQDRCRENKRGGDFGQLTGVLLFHNPGWSPKHEEPAPDNALSVHLFWNPYHLPGKEPAPVNFFDIVTLGPEVWAVAYLGPKKYQIYDVKLPDFQTSVVDMEGIDLGNSKLTVTQDALWILSSESNGRDNPRQKIITRHDRLTGENQRWPIPAGQALDVVNGRLFVWYNDKVNGAGLAELNLKSGEFKLIVSAMRNPPETPFDEREEWNPEGVIPRHGNDLYVAMGKPDNGLFELGGNWKKIIPIHMVKALRYNGCYLLTSEIGEAVYIDPNKTGKEFWLAGPKNSTKTQAKAKWITWSEIKEPLFNMAFRPGELFILEQDETGAHRLHCWFDGGPREGVFVPLVFHFPNAEKEFLASMGSRFRITNGIISLDSIIDPERAVFPLKLRATDKGLILAAVSHGFWFIPNDELHAAIAKADKVLNVAKSESKNP